jgi:hypothetical protein
MSLNIIVNNDNVFNSPKAAITTSINTCPPTYTRTSSIKLVLELTVGYQKYTTRRDFCAPRL